MRSAEQLFAELGNKEVKRPNNTTEDRKLRDYIEDANRNGDFIIPTGERGYRRIDLSNEVDRCNANRYLIKEQARVSSMLDKLNVMTATLKRASLSTEGLKA